MVGSEFGKSLNPCCFYQQCSLEVEMNNCCQEYFSWLAGSLILSNHHSDFIIQISNHHSDVTREILPCLPHGILCFKLLEWQLLEWTRCRILWGLPCWLSMYIPLSAHSVSLCYEMTWEVCCMNVLSKKIKNNWELANSIGTMPYFYVTKNNAQYNWYKEQDEWNGLQIQMWKH